MSIMMATSRPAVTDAARMRRMIDPGPVVLGVRHVEADDVDAGGDEFDEHLLALGGGPEGGDDLGAAEVGGHGGQQSKKGVPPPGATTEKPQARAVSTAPQAAATAAG